MAKYIPPEKMTAQQIQTELDQEFQRWNDIACKGCQDPGWPDGVNMNLVRNHIIYWYKLLDEKQNTDTQTSLFDSQAEETPRRPIPPEVPDQYTVSQMIEKEDDGSHRVRWGSYSTLDTKRGQGTRPGLCCLL